MAFWTFRTPIVPDRRNSFVRKFQPDRHLLVCKWPNLLKINCFILIESNRFAFCGSKMYFYRFILPTASMVSQTEKKLKSDVENIAGAKIVGHSAAPLTTPSRTRHRLRSKAVCTRWTLCPGPYDEHDNTYNTTFVQRRKWRKRAGRRREKNKTVVA